MARLKKETVDYFPHFTASGKTLFILENDFGNDGYAFWFKLLELLGTTSGHIYDCRNVSAWKFLLAKTRVSEDVACRILDTLADLDAIDKELWEERLIWSDNFVKNLAPVSNNRKASLPQKPIFNSRNTSTDEFLPVENEQSGISTPINQQRKVKESKVDKSRVEERKGKDLYVGPSDQPEAADRVPYDEIKSLFNELCLSFPRIISITDKRKPHIRARWEQFKGNMQIFETAFTKLEESEFCKGNNDRRWKASFDWLIANDTNLVKVLEGKYDNKTPAKIEPKQWGILRELYADAEREEREIDKNRSD
jgi:hypothetical protein